jgi:hypothetical protein
MDKVKNPGNSEYREQLISKLKYYIQSAESECQNENISIKSELLRVSESRVVVNACSSFLVLVLCWKFKTQTNLFICHLRLRKFKIEKQIYTTTMLHFSEEAGFRNDTQQNLAHDYFFSPQ